MGSKILDFHVTKHLYLKNLVFIKYNLSIMALSRENQVKLNLFLRIIVFPNISTTIVCKTLFLFLFKLKRCLSQWFE